jgi:anion-transporting  ArsA/GET3 family ATPase
MGERAPNDWVGWSTRFLHFTGKGEVGKTTIAAQRPGRVPATAHLNAC